MSTVIIKPRPDAPAPRPEDEPIIKNVFFFPDIRPADVRDVMRIEGTITAPRLRLAIKSALAEVNAELFTYTHKSGNTLGLILSPQIRCGFFYINHKAFERVLKTGIYQL